MEDEAGFWRTPSTPVRKAPCRCGQNGSGARAATPGRLADGLVIDAGAGSSAWFVSSPVPVGGANAVTVLVTVVNSVAFTSLKVYVDQSADGETWSDMGTEAATISSTCSLTAVTVKGPTTPILTPYVRVRLSLTGTAGVRAIVNVDLHAASA